MKRIQLENRTDLKNEIPLEAPYSLFIDPSSSCNFRCKFCMNDKIKDPGIMSFDLYRKIIDDLQDFENPVKTVRLYGFGEPLLNRNFCDMVRYAKDSSKVINVDTTTNASRLDPDMNKRLIDSGIDRINISIEGINQRQYHEFTGKDIDFNGLVENIADLHRISGDTTIFVKINGDYLSVDDKRLFLEIFKLISNGCDIEHTMNCWYDMDITVEDPRKGIYGQALEDVEVCSYIFYSMLIQADGQVSTCFLDWDKRMIVGDVRKCSVKSVWDSEKFFRFRVNMLNGFKNDICSNCQQLRGGMPVNLDEHKEMILWNITSKI